jgi:hypothetical protein
MFIIGKKCVETINKKNKEEAVKKFLCVTAAYGADGCIICFLAPGVWQNQPKVGSNNNRNSCVAFFVHELIYDYCLQKHEQTIKIYIYIYIEKRGWHDLKNCPPLVQFLLVNMKK